MHNEKKYPFHGTGVQGLEETDPARRIGSAVLLNADIDDAWLLKSILWTDESKFSGKELLISTTFMNGLIRTAIHIGKNRTGGFSRRNGKDSKMGPADFS
ncbi:hypothetical protein JTB14_016955 [Gonioctena quinquepunctata]|nr:hypothetical protein JTB14_016955 [Gonioctena quinquepunctata]